MKFLVKFRENARRIEANPESLESLKGIIVKELDMNEQTKFLIKIFDAGFEDYCELVDLNELQNYSKLLIEVVNDEAETPPQNETVGLPQKQDPKKLLSTLRTTAWNPSVIQIKKEELSVVVRESLERAMEEFENNNGRLYEAPFGVKKELRQLMASILLKYTFYPTKDQYVTICKALIRDFPCLREPIGDGYSGWICAVRYKIEDERRKAKGQKEVANNSGKRSKTNPGGDPANKRTKKPKRGEVNFAPNSVVTKQDGLAIKTLMQEDSYNDDLELHLEETYALRREEILENPPLATFKAAWPKVFSVEQLYKEVERLTNVNIDEHFDASLSKLTEDLLEIFKLCNKNDKEANENDLLEYLPTFFKEKWSFFHDGEEADAAEFDPKTSVRLHVKEDKTYDVEGERVQLVQNIQNLKEGAKCLIAVYYVCNITYPKKGINSMSFLQYLCGIRGGKIPQKTQNLISKMEKKTQTT